MQREKLFVLDSLTNAEQKLLMASGGMPARQIAEAQDKSVSAIKVMLNNTCNKIGANNLVDAVGIAAENDIEKYVK